MFLMDIKALKYGLAVAAMATFAGTAMAKTIVVRATGPSSSAYPAGKVLPDNGSVTLKANDVVVILDAKGTRTLRGAGKHSLAATTQTASTAQSSFQKLLASTGARPSRGGVSRGGGNDDTGAPARSPNLWFVDGRQEGTVCVADPAEVKLWRPQVEGDSSATITNAAGASKTITFISGSMIKAWPTAEMPVTDGATYTVRMEGGKTVPIRFALVSHPAAEVAPALEDTAETLAKRGCSAQLDLLAAAVGGDAGTPTPAS